MAYGDERGREAGSSGLSAARGILIGLGIAALMWMLIIAGVVHIFFN